jgi:type I restriction enzyme R subunit
VLIENVNKKFGTSFTEMDKVLLQLENAYVNDPKWQGHAKSSDIKTFMTLFNKEFPAKAADRYEQNDEFFKKLFNEPGMMEMVMAGIGNAVYERLRSAGQHT